MKVIIPDNILERVEITLSKILERERLMLAIVKQKSLKQTIKSADRKQLVAFLQEFKSL